MVTAMERSVRPSVTIVVTPWQHFSQTKAALESIYAFTPPPFELVYVDGNAPAKVRRYLQEQARARGFTLVRSDHYLTTAEAQNLALPHITTEYVAFLENWVIVTSGWLDALLRCARETSAWVVEPLYCTGDPRSPTVYSMAPDLQIVEEDGKRRLHETAPLAGKPLVEVRGGLRRSRCGYAKSHCMLVRKDVLDRIQSFDESFTSFQGHRDFSLDVQAAGGSLFAEPDAVVVLSGVPPLALSDLGLYFLRWSDIWLQPSIRHFAKKWGIPEDDYMLQGGARFRDGERRRPFRLAAAVATRLFGARGRRLVDIMVDTGYKYLLEPTVVARLERDRLRARGTAAIAASMTTSSANADA